MQVSQDAGMSCTYVSKEEMQLMTGSFIKSRKTDFAESVLKLKENISQLFPSKHFVFKDVEKSKQISKDCLVFGARIWPCHIININIIYD